jgi:hypothetical protein
MGMPTVLSWPATVTMSYSTLGYVTDGRWMVVPSATSLNAPTGTAVMTKRPWPSETTGCPMGMGMLLLLAW